MRTDRARSGARHRPAASARRSRSCLGFRPAEGRTADGGCATRRARVRLKLMLVELDGDVASGCAEEFDQLVGMVVRAFASALDRIEVFVRVLGGGESRLGGRQGRASGASRSSACRRARRRSRSARRRGLARGGQSRASARRRRRTSCRWYAPRSADRRSRPSGGFRRACSPPSGDRSATGGSYVGALMPSVSASRARSLRKARPFVFICHRRGGEVEDGSAGLAGPVAVPGAVVVELKAWRCGRRGTGSGSCRCGRGRCR